MNRISAGFVCVFLALFVIVTGVVRVFGQSGDLIANGSMNGVEGNMPTSWSGDEGHVWLSTDANLDGLYYGVWDNQGYGFWQDIGASGYYSVSVSFYYSNVCASAGSTIFRVVVSDTVDVSVSPLESGYVTVDLLTGSEDVIHFSFVSSACEWGYGYIDGVSAVGWGNVGPTPTPTSTSTPTSTPTPTPTNTPTPTWTPTQTFTPGPTYTPAATPTYRATFESLSSREIDPGGGSSALGSLLQLGTQTKTQMDSINLMFSTTIDDTALRIHAYSPLPLLRGAAIVFADFDWLVKLVGWFIFAAIVIILVSAVRFFISAWGIIQRLLEIIKAIPFI